MMKIFDLLNYKTKKQLLAYLKNDWIPYSISKNHEGQKYVLFSITEEKIFLYEKERNDFERKLPDSLGVQ